jgi:hypothetical protein
VSSFPGEQYFNSSRVDETHHRFISASITAQAGIQLTKVDYVLTLLMYLSWIPYIRLAKYLVHYFMSSIVYEFSSGWI